VTAAAHAIETVDEPRADGQPHQQRSLDTLGDVATLASEAILRT
jgi:hypothetical protein